MADKKFSQFTAVPAPTDALQLVGYEGSDNKRILATALTQVVNIPVFNNTGVTITKGTPLTGGGTYTAGIPNIVIADADIAEHVISFFGLATEDILDGAVGQATHQGAVVGADTSLLSVAPIYLASGGGLTNAIPKHPTYRLLIGGVSVSDAVNGVIGITSVSIPRSSTNKSFFFTSQGIGSGMYWESGFYDWSSTDANLTQASTSVTYGTANAGRAAHVGVVPSGAGSVDTGQVGIRVTGTLDNESGAQVAAQTQVITEDITTLTANVMTETTGKFSGNVTIELYVVSGSPTTYSLDFNYGFSKYEDFSNSDITLTGIEAKWRGAAGDSASDIAFLHHKSTGWTYAATGFSPGNGDIARKSVDQAIDGDIANGVDGAWKRLNLNVPIEGSGSEGVIIQIDAGVNNTYQTLDLHMTGVRESI